MELSVEFQQITPCNRSHVGGSLGGVRGAQRLPLGGGREEGVAGRKKRGLLIGRGVCVGRYGTAAAMGMCHFCPANGDTPYCCQVLKG